MSYAPFFVTGAPKSGTTWLGRLLDAHPEISCKGEACVHAFIKGLIKISNEYNGMLGGRSGAFLESNEFPPLKEAEVYAMGRHFIELRLEVIADKSKSRLRFVGEKDPLHVVNFPTLNRMFPEAKVLHIIRDGRSVLVSAWHHNLRITKQANDPAAFDRFMNAAAEEWGSMHRRAMDTRSILGDRYLEVRYESLLTDPGPQMVRILNHLGANSEEATLRVCLEEASFEKLAKGRVQGQEDSQSFFRKGTADDWKTQMTASQIQRFNARSGGMLEELGYLADS
ncbi:MAG: sulfotransferase [Acidobacteria bacterium]|nr:sulfotransferase [Acidobacteriota bacterium]